MALRLHQHERADQMPARSDRTLHRARAGTAVLRPRTSTAPHLPEIQHSTGTFLTDIDGIPARPPARDRQTNGKVHAFRTDEEKMLRKALLLGGVVSSLLYVVGIDAIAALRYPDYHDYADQMVSELIAVGAPTRSLMVWL